MSTVEIDVDHLKKENKDIISFMGSIKNKLIESARKLITVKTNVKLGLGVNATFVKVADNKEEADSGISNTISTKHASVHSKAQVARVVDSLIEDLLFMFENTKHKGSGYSVKKIHRVFLKSYTVKPVRGSSYIPTPEKFAHNKCGLVNIKNEDNECFKWCMKYHQTKREKNCDRITVLKKVEDKYDYTGVDFPASYDDIRTFEENNKVSVFVYYVDSENNIRTDKSGNSDYIINDIIYLLKISQSGDESTNTCHKEHYVYIKHIERLFNLHHQGIDKDKRFCPMCNGKIKFCEYSNHLKACYQFHKEGSLIKLPDPESFMKFKNHNIN
jgi:hypothetical protein